MNGYYSPGLVALSIAIAILASYTALDLASRVGESNSSPRRRAAWLIAGAISMGSGIWSMHFIGMLAFHLPIPVAYDVLITAVSLIIAIAVSAVALFVLRRPKWRWNHVLVGATLMGVGISAMHYTGMGALRMSPGIRYDPALFLVSIAIAFAASFAALVIAFRLRGSLSRFAIIAKLGSAGVMGLAIIGMHYTAMAAAHFASGSICRAAAASGITNTTLAFTTGGFAVAIMTLTLVLSTLDGHFAAKNARLAESLRIARDAADGALKANERITAELRAAQSELMANARQAGMAEIANNVLHNIGNVLTSLNISAGLIADRLRDSKAQSLGKAMQMLNEHATDLPEFLTRDERGKVLPGYLSKLSGALAAERLALIEELQSMTRSIDHIKEIVSTQQSYSGAMSVVEPVQVAELMEDALRMNATSFSRHQISVVKEFADIPSLLLDKHLLLQVLINLIGNAKQAMEPTANPSHQITLRTQLRETIEGLRLCIGVEDNGEGIASENRKRLFTHGFTTRKDGHGFGLHSCALAAKEMRGSITAHSDGAGRGAIFTLEIPVSEAFPERRLDAAEVA
jgi:NO-binding membrane sensor protein with MHYT domain